MDASSPQLTGILDRFDQAWAQDAAPAIDEFLPTDDSETCRRDILIELIMVDLERRWRSGSGEGATLQPDQSGLPVRRNSRTMQRATRTLARSKNCRWI